MKFLMYHNHGDEMPTWQPIPDPCFIFGTRPIILPCDCNYKLPNPRPLLPY